MLPSSHIHIQWIWSLTVGHGWNSRAAPLTRSHGCSEAMSWWSGPRIFAMQSCQRHLTSLTMEISGQVSDKLHGVRKNSAVQLGRMIKTHLTNSFLKTMRNYVNAKKQLILDDFVNAPWNKTDWYILMSQHVFSFFCDSLQPHLRLTAQQSSTFVGQCRVPGISPAAPGQNNRKNSGRRPI